VEAETPSVASQESVTDGNALVTHGAQVKAPGNPAEPARSPTGRNE
jgi:hypothetical protein